MADETTADLARALVAQYREAVPSMSAEGSAEAAMALASALRLLERANARDTLGDALLAEDAVEAARRMISLRA